MTHTPGPWKVEKQRALNGGTYYRIYDTDDAHSVIAQVIGDGRIEYHDNARLMAAAPDLLEALENLLFRAAQFYGEIPLDAIRAARAALAKAKGAS